MADQWIFDAPASVNGRTIKGLTVNGRGFDELYCNGKHIAHFSKDVSVIFTRTRCKTIIKFSKTYEKTDSCGYFDGYGRTYYVVLEHYARLQVIQNSASPGKRIKQIDWGKHDGAYNHYVTGKITEPSSGVFEYSTGQQTFVLTSVENASSVPPEDWRGDVGDTFSLSTYQKAKMTLTFYDGTTKSGSDGWHLSRKTSYTISLTPGAQFYGSNNCTISATK